MTNTEQHTPECTKPGFRYGLTRKDGRVVMLCKNPKCRAIRVV